MSLLKDSLHRSHFLDQVIETLPDALVLTDETGLVISCNLAVRMFGYAPSEAEGGSLGLLLRPADWNQIAGLLAASMNSDQSEELRTGRRITGVNKTGGTFPISVNITECFLGEKKLFAFVIRDITAILNTESELERSNEELQHFAAVASHDLQAPLRTISTFASSLLSQHAGSDPDARQKLERIVSACQRMRDLTDSLLELARISRKARAFDSVDTSKVFDDVTKDLSALIAEAGATVTRSELPRVQGNEAQIRQVFQNLITNGLKFRRKEAAPVVRVVAAEAGAGFQEFRVSDNGIGIENAYYSRIFELFQRLHGKSQYAGSGIGLAQVKKIVERHGGRIGVESRVGEGSCFFFTLKGAEKKAEAASQSRLPPRNIRKGEPGRNSAAPPYP